MTTVSAVHGTAGTTAFRAASARADTADADIKIIRVGGSQRVNATARNGKKLVHASLCGREECPSQISILLRHDPRKPRKNHETGSIPLDLAPDLGSAHTDVTKLRQSLLNLLSNAAKFTENGVITLSARRGMKPNGDVLVFSVQDSGIGMTGEQLSKLFERFAQADASTTRRFGGTGLGLSITKAFATMLGGDVLAASVYGIGTTFTLVVPTMLANQPGCDVSTVDQ